MVKRQGEADRHPSRPSSSVQAGCVVDVVVSSARVICVVSVTS